MRKLLKWAPFLILTLALGLLYRELQHLRMQELTLALAKYTWREFAFAFGLVAFNYLLWGGYDFVSLRQIGAKIPFSQIFKTTSIAFPITNLVGYSIITGLAIRLRRYSPYNLSMAQITQMMMFNVESWWAGFIFASGFAIIHSPIVGTLFKLSERTMQMLGVALIALIGVYLIGCWRARGRTVKLVKAKIFLPDLLSGTMKVLVGATDSLIVGLTLFAVLPPGHGISFDHFIAFYLAAQLLAILSFVPGGLGVLEGALLFLLRPYASDADILTSLVLFRLVHYLSPVLVASALMTILENFPRPPQEPKPLL